MVIDGLRFDYLLDFENMEHDDKLKANKFKKLNQAFYQDPEKFVVMRAYADVPTLTIMRVPCFMTGNIPQRANIVTAFGPVSAKEDSVFRQLQLEKKKSFLAGDLTLFYYFGQYLELLTPQDLDFFDNRNEKIDEYAHPAVRKKIAENDYDFFASHLLRIDHMGHAYALYDQHIPNAINDVEELLLEIIAGIDDDTILVFGGDHGMTTDGNHGGDLPQETNTAFMAYHKRGFMKYKNKDNQDMKKVMRSVNETENQVRQVDIVPTLSMLAGVPIPFSNMGSILNDLYPVGDYYPNVEGCPDVGFEMQMVQDNHLNTLQIMNYFEKYQNDLHIFNKEEYSKITNLAKEEEKAYKAAQAMIDKSQQCEEAFHEAAAQVILKSQEISNQVYELVNFKVPYDMGIFAQGFILLLMVTVSYILLVQYLYKTKDYERLTKARFLNVKGLAFLAGILILVWIGLLASGAKVIQPIVTSVFLVGSWMFGSSLMFFLRRKDQDNENDIPLRNFGDDESRMSTISSSSNSSETLFLFERPLICMIAAGLFGFLFYLIHAVNVDREKIDKLHPANPYFLTMLFAIRACGSYPKFSKYITIAAAGLCTLLYLMKVQVNFWSETVNIVMGLLLIADWVWSEINFTMNKLKANKIWSFQYVACFAVLVGYHLAPNRSIDLIQIYLPRLVWVIIIGSILASIALKLDRPAIKRNMQVYLVLFMVLLQVPTRVLYFAMALSAMRIAAYLFRRVDSKNYLYPIIISFIGYIGLFMLNYTDRKLPDTFGAAFVGLRSFNIVFSIVFSLLSMMSTLVLGLLFLSYYDQDVRFLHSEEIDLYIQKEDEGFAIKSHSNIIRKRNIILYGFLYNLVLISAAIKLIVYIDNLRAEGVMEKYMVDAGLYSTMMTGLYLML